MSNNLNFESTPVKPPRRGDKYSKDTVSNMGIINEIFSFRYLNNIHF